MDEINVDNNIDVVQSAVRVMLNFVKHLAKCPGKVPARDPSALRFVGMTTEGVNTLRKQVNRRRSESRGQFTWTLPNEKEGKET